ncbi:MAG: hypothetical protein GX823_04455, partial [Clostridiales bacterium]|nr:hypothetical protein [Clostridiales bacterium]
GSLVVTDLFTRGAPKSFEGLLGRLDTWPAVLDQVERAGFELCFFEEHGGALATFWAQLVFDCGLDEAKRLVCGCADDLKSSDSSYFLAVFKAV